MCSSCLLQVSSPCELGLVHGSWLNELSQFKLGRLGHWALVHISSLGMTSKLRERGWEMYIIEVNHLPSYCNWLRLSSNRICRGRTCAMLQCKSSSAADTIVRERMCKRKSNTRTGRRYKVGTQGERGTYSYVVTVQLCNEYSLP